MARVLVVAGTSACFAAALIVVAFLALADDGSQQFSGRTDRMRRNLRGLQCFSFTACGDPVPSSNFEPTTNVFNSVGKNARPVGRAPGPTEVEEDPTQRFGIDRPDPFPSSNYEPLENNERTSAGRTSSGAAGKCFGFNCPGPFLATNYEPSDNNGRTPQGRAPLRVSPTGPSPVGRAPSEAVQEMKRALILHRKSARKFRRRVGGRDYTYEYSIEEYNSNIGRNGGREIQPFANLDYTAVSVQDGIVSPRGRSSVMYLYSKINKKIRNAINRPELLGQCSFRYSRRYGLPRFIYCEHDGKVLKVSAKNLNTISSPAA
mmetsp:Transcript_39945/g.82200  ORF Transcript_39945/g.82200 Transcript_39945/m.82200 type:complete len:318 (+) Transcript_39945:125-1078(+)